MPTQHQQSTVGRPSPASGFRTDVFPAAPVRALLTLRMESAHAAIAQLADVLGIPLRTMHRILTADQLRWDTADRIAIALGHHPCELWPDWFDQYAAGGTKRVA